MVLDVSRWQEAVEACFYVHRCFVINEFTKGHIEKIKVAMIEFYTADEISSCKKTIFDNAMEIETDIILLRDFAIGLHHDMDVHIRASKDMDDIFMLLSALNGHNLLDLLPRYVTDSIDKLPSLSSEKCLDKISGRIDSMEKAIENMSVMLGVVLDFVHSQQRKANTQPIIRRTSLQATRW